MKLLYNLTFIIFGIVYLPYLIVTKRYRFGLCDRLGFIPARIKSISAKGKVIWIHAVSVGEMKAASILAPLLRKSFPAYTLIFSSITYTGNAVARTIATGNEGVFYLPFDISFIVNKVVKIIKPELFLSLETEIWPNLISSLYKNNTKIVLVNGRISDRSYCGYKKIRFLISGILSRFSLLLMQSERDAVRILSLGAPGEKVLVTGNLKFDLALVNPVARRREIRERLNIKNDEVLLIGGSTHRGEEELLVDCFSKLKEEYGDLRLLIAPRHIERTKEVEQLLSRRGLNCVRVSKVKVPAVDTVFILDTIGELKSYYAASDIVFIGGSLVKKGGQNPIEAASLARPIIFGKFTFNFRDVVGAFLENGAALQVEDDRQLYSGIRFLLQSPAQRKRLGINARDTVAKNSGSSQRTIELIQSLIKP